MQQTSDPPFHRFAHSSSGRGEAVAQGYLGFCQTDHTWSPCVNLYETEGSYRVCVDLAGVEKDRIDLTVQGSRLVLSGERMVPRSPTSATPGRDGQASRVRIHRMEIDHGRFVREVELPADVDPEAISATYRNGLLWIELPKLR